ncbi:uncharacterized protein V1518DRAFT_420346 [Limtongia smithiae]|uniref:uncharacterized protein n=1 Tax=Limtongia smithiae TaxID=1125753 RepID=UPI0034CD5FB0
MTSSHHNIASRSGGNGASNNGTNGTIGGNSHGVGSSGNSGGSNKRSGGNGSSAAGSLAMASHGGHHGGSNAGASSAAYNGVGLASGAGAGVGGLAAGIGEEGLHVDPINFEKFPDSALRKYRTHYGLPEKSNISGPGMLLNGSAGKRTFSYKHRTRITKDELAGAVKRHFAAQPTRETDMIVAFLYSARNQDKEFKLRFKGT